LPGAVTRVFGETRRSRRLVVFSFAVMLFGLLMPAARAQTVVNYANGFAGAGSAIVFGTFSTYEGSKIHLVLSTVHNADNAWYTTPVNIQAFTTTFTFNVDCSNAGPGGCGDGFGFQFINNNTQPNYPSYYSGYSGGQFSYSQCVQPISGGVGGSSGCPIYPNALVKFDVYNENATGYYINGEFPQPPNMNLDMGPSGINMQSGDIIKATLTYNGSTLAETVTDTVTGATYNTTYTGVNLPAAVGANVATVGFSGGTGAAEVDVYIDSWTYTVESPGQAAMPTFSPAAGTYSGSQSVTLSTPSSGAAICYNTTGSPGTNGSTGCSSGTLYTGPITVSSSETLYAVAGGTGYNDSPVASASYVIQSTVSTPTFSPAAGTYSSAQSVSISDATSNATIYYTTNGTAPTTSSTQYTGPITVSSTEKLEAIAVAAGDTNSAVASAAYTITSLPSAATPTFSPAAGSYSSAQSVTISDGTSGAAIYYTTDGSIPTTSSTQYTGPITVSSTGKLEAIAVAAGDTNSAVATAAYTINLSLPSAATPTLSPGAGSYSSAQSVTISDATSGSTIYYTTNGATPTTSSTAYTGPITVSSTETLVAIAVATGYSNSMVGSATYTISLPSVSTPTFSPAAGAYTSGPSVTISDATSGAAIYYTTNGTIPTTASTAYIGPITVGSTETLEAIAVAKGDANSAIASAAYTIASSLPTASAPTFSPAAGSYSSTQSVTLSDATSGATIYYTIDGSTPTASSTAYTGPITVSSTETLEAIAVATGDSAVASAVYSISSQPNFVLGTSVSSLTVNPGGQGTVMLTVTPENGFDSPVILACSGLPTWATCAFEQATVTPSGGAATTQLTISTNTQSAALQHKFRPFFPFTALAMTVCLFGWGKRRGRHQWLLLAVTFAGMGLLFGCGGTSGGGGTSGTPAVTSTTSTVTVTAISGTLQGTAAIAVTVN